MNEERFKVLKTMNEATSRMDIHMFAEAVGLTSEQAIAKIQELAKLGFLRKVNGGFSVTDKGKRALKAFVQVPNGKEFSFYVWYDKPLGFSSASLQEFYRDVRRVFDVSLEFHFNRGDFESWVRWVCEDADLADVFAKLKSAGVKGEELRKALLRAIDERYGVKDLI